ncbi:gamma-glutamylcyclotransferase family protein [Geminicoccus roseus]|uniref:gamma-glutamylcyclotransferase family protein n=1 Tax=Geminicoccus roseus TaxID=404900 RepID=UPI000427EBC7|nr:gamma-glutamylcyclotransferase family protein [Geminicoccus roseus]
MDWFFFYGTLMDRDVLDHVLSRQVEDQELVPAILHGHRRVTCPGFVYPCLVEAPQARVTGLALASPSRKDLVRLHWFEEGEYGASLAPIWLLDGRRVQARYFTAYEDVLPAGAEEWCPMTWATRDKPGYLDQCAGWMDGCPDPDTAHPFVRRVLGDPARAAA